MQDLEKLREIEEWGQEEEQPLSEEPPESAGNPLPLIQAAVCLLILAGLLSLLCPMVSAGSLPRNPAACLGRGSSPHAIPLSIAVTFPRARSQCQPLG